jgi:hypothetical protein
MPGTPLTAHNKPIIMFVSARYTWDEKHWEDEIVQWVIFLQKLHQRDQTKLCVSIGNAARLLYQREGRKLATGYLDGLQVGNRVDMLHLSSNNPSGRNRMAALTNLPKNVNNFEMIAAVEKICIDHKNENSGQPIDWQLQIWCMAPSSDRNHFRSVFKTLLLV